MKNIKRTLVISNSGIVFVALAVLTTVLILVEMKSLNTTVSTNAQNLTVQAYSQLDAFFTSPEKVVEHSVKFVKSQEKDKKGIESFFGSLTEANGNFEMLYYCDALPVKDGGAFFSDVHWYPAATYDQTSTPWYQNSMKSLFTKISDPFPGPITGKKTVAVSRCVTKAGEKTGIVALNINLTKVNEILSLLRMSSTGKSYLINSKGIYVTNDDDSKIMKGNFFADYNLDLTCADFKNDLFLRTKIGNNEYLIARKVLDNSDWYFVSIGDRGELYSDINQNIGFTLVILIVCMILSVFIGLLIASRLVKPINDVGKSINNISSGDADLTNRIDTNRSDAIGKLIKEFNGFVEKLQGIVNEIKKSKDNLAYVKDSLAESVRNTADSITKLTEEISRVSDQMGTQGSSVSQTSAAVNQIANNIDNMERLIETQASGVSQASAAVEEMIGNINSVNASVEKMAASFKDLEKSAGTGVENQRNVMEQITLIEQQSKSLLDANKAIASVASQTNLLAMNAAIEAAHAGEAGRGFAVVAEEIRKLSESSSAQSKLIGSELKDIQKTISVVVQSSRASTKSFDEVNEKIGFTDEIVNHIKNAMDEQNEGSKQIADALRTMNDSTSEVRSASTEMQEGNKQILSEINNLQQVTSVIQGSVSSMTSTAEGIKTMGQTLSDISGQVDKSISEIAVQIDQFHT